jgi:hypothetical protein
MVCSLRFEHGRFKIKGLRFNVKGVKLKLKLRLKIDVLQGNEIKRFNKSCDFANIASKHFEYYIVSINFYKINCK